MEGVLVPIALFIAIAFVIVRLAEVTSESLTRRQVIRTGVSPEQAEKILAAQERRPDRAGALKWGLVACAVGLALILLQFLPYQADDPIAIGLVLLAGGAGLLTFVAVTYRDAKRV